MEQKNWNARKVMAALIMCASIVIAATLAGWHVIHPESDAAKRGDGQKIAVPKSRPREPARAEPDLLASLVSSHRLEPGIARRVGDKAFVTERTPEYRPPGDAAAIVATLLPASQRGEADATYRIYLLAKECEEAISPSAISSYQLIRPLAPSYPQHLANLMKECEGLLTDPAMPRRGHWLSLAAEQGSVEAAVVYSLDIEQIVGGPKAWVEHPEQVIEYKRKAVVYLERAAALGNINALSALSDTYEAGFVVPADPVKALAYQEVVERVDPSDANRWLRDRLSKEMSQSQLQDARQQASQIYETCCIRH